MTTNQTNCLRCGDLIQEFYAEGLCICVDCLKRYQGQSSGWLLIQGRLGRTPILISMALFSLMLLIIFIRFTIVIANLSQGTPAQVPVGHVGFLVFATVGLIYGGYRLLLYNSAFEAYGRRLSTEFGLTESFEKQSVTAQRAFLCYEYFDSTKVKLPAAFGMLYQLPGGLLFINTVINCLSAARSRSLSRCCRQNSSAVLAQPAVFS